MRSEMIKGKGDKEIRGGGEGEIRREKVDGERHKYQIRKERME